MLRIKKQINALWQGCRALLFTTAVTILFLMACVPSTDAQSNKDYAMGSMSHKEISRIFNLPYPLPAFNPNRSAEDLKASCKTWTSPQSSDPYANDWYRAATAIHAKAPRTPEKHLQMLQLYEAAARKGHYNAVKNLTILFSSGSSVIGGKFRPEPAKARYWLYQAIYTHQWVGALEWVPHIMGADGSGFNNAADYKLAYFQQAADMGVALAQYQLGETYLSRFKAVDQRMVLVRCAADQGLGAAAYTMGANMTVGKEYDEAMHYFQIAVMNGSEAGGKAAYSLQTFPDYTFESERRAIYKELDAAIRGTTTTYSNYFYRFPMLNEVLALPPAALKEWKGIYSAMSDEDAAYYQNPPPPEFYLKQVAEQGLMLHEDSISQWQPRKPIN